MSKLRQMCLDDHRETKQYAVSIDNAASFNLLNDILKEWLELES